MLRSLPIIGPWTNKPAETADTGGGGQHAGYGRFHEETFVVAPNDLLAFDEVSDCQYLTVVDINSKYIGICTWYMFQPEKVQSSS